MWTILFLVMTIVFLIKWKISELTFKALIYYIVEKGSTVPTKRELEQCITIVVKETVEAVFGKRN